MAGGLRLRYYAYRGTTSWGLYLPVSIVYLLDRGFGVGFVALAQASFSLSLLLAELPSGYLGDRLGRRRSLAVGGVLRAVGLAGYALVDSAAGFLAMQALFGVGWAFRSGTHDAWLYDVLADRGEAEEFAHVDGRGSTAVLVVSAVGAVSGGVLYGVAPTLPFLANAALSALGPVVLWTLPAGGDGDDAPGDGPDGPLSPRAAVDALRVQATRPSVRWVVAYTVLVFLVFSLSRTFEQPALDAVGVPVAGMGLVYAALKLVSAGAATTTGWLQDRLGARGTLGLAAPVVVLTYGAVAVTPLAVLPVVFVYRSLRVVVGPVRNQYLNDRIDDAGRATVLSGVSMVLSVTAVLGRVLTGAVASVVGPVAVLAGLGVVLGTAAGALWLAVSPVRPAESARDPAPAD